MVGQLSERLLVFRLELISQWIKITKSRGQRGGVFRLELISQWIKMNPI